MPAQRVPYSHAHLHRYANCPRSFQLHYVDDLPAETNDAAKFGGLLHRACATALRDHVTGLCSGPIEPAQLVSAYRDAWIASELTDPARFEQGLELAKAWAVRQGWIDSCDILAIAEPFDLDLDGTRLVGTFDRVDRHGDALRVRRLTSARVPLSREDVEADFQLAILDLAARDLWPNVSQVTLEIELLRHGTVIRTERTDAQRAATREYIRATIAKIEAAERAADFPPRPNLQCTTCEHRSQCPAYADALAAKRTFVCTDSEDLAAVSREREEVARLVKVLSSRKEALEAALKAKLHDVDALHVAGMRYALGTTTTTDYPIAVTLEALERVTGLGTTELLARVAAVSAPALRKLLAELAPTLPSDAFSQLKTTLETLAHRSFSLRLIAKEDAAVVSQGDNR